MSNGVQVTFPMGEVNKLFAAMQYASDNLNLDNGQAMKRAVNALLNSLGTSTRVSPKFREIKDSTWLDPNAKRPQGWKAKNLLAFDVTGWFGKPRKQGTVTVWSRDMQTAKKRHATITRRGLARLTWKLAGKMIADRISIKLPTLESAITNKIAAENVEGKANYTGADIYAEIHNSLPYIQQALQGGPKDVNTAFDRAARGLMASVDKQLVKRMGLGKLST